MARSQNVGGKVRTGFLHAFDSLRQEQYRLLWLGTLFSIAGMQIDMIARAWLAYDLSGSGFMLGIVTATRGLPQLLLSPYSGVAADRYDKRKLLFWSQLAVFATAVATAFLVHAGLITIWQLALLGLFQGIATPFTMPTRTALIPDLVKDSQIPNALALESTARNINRVVVPALAGVLLMVNVSLAYYAVAAAYGLAVITIYRLPRGLRGEGGKQGVMAEMIYGFRFVFERPTLFALLAMAYVPILLGMPHQSLLPVFQKDVLNVSESALGLMYTVGGIGAIVGSVLIATISTSPYINRLQIISGIIFGLTLVGFALTTNYYFALFMLTLVGFFNTGYLTINRLLVGMQTPKGMYGRVMAIYGMTWSIMPIALLPVGYLVDRYGVQNTVAVSGAMVSIFIAVIALMFAGIFLSARTRETSVRA